MATPVITSASLDKPTYKVGDKMTLTVVYGDTDTKALTVSIVVTDAEGNKSAPTTATAVIDPLTLSVTDSSGKVWTTVSNNGSVAVLTSVA